MRVRSDEQRVETTGSPEPERAPSIDPLERVVGYTRLCAVRGRLCVPTLIGKAEAFAFVVVGGDFGWIDNVVAHRPLVFETVTGQRPYRYGLKTD